MSRPNGTPSKTEWTLGECAQIQSAVVRAIPQALSNIESSPKDVLYVFGDTGEIFEKEINHFFANFVEKNFPTLSITSDLVVDIPDLPRPKQEELTRDFPKMSPVIVKDISPTKSVYLRFGTLLRNNENSLSLDKCRERLGFLSSSPLAYQRSLLASGLQQARWLLQHEQGNLRECFGSGHIYFLGLTVRSVDDGYLYSPSLYKRENGSLDFTWRDVSMLSINRRDIIVFSSDKK